MNEQFRSAIHSLSLLLLAQALTGCATNHASGDAAYNERAKPLLGTRATYCSVPRKPDGRADIDRLVSELTDIHANTYSFCIHSAATDWDDFKLFLPAARQKGIRVWASLVPPSESPPRTKLYAEPFRLDYERWAVEFAKLSRKEPNFIAWSIDDFTHNLKFYTPAYLKKMLDASREINPKLAFVPCCYYPTINAQFVTNYCSLLDGILFPYRHESGVANLKDASLVEPELKKIKDLVGRKFPVILDIYASAHSRLGATTPEYLQEAMTGGHNAADGVMVYRHQDPTQNAEKYKIVKQNFTAWAESKK
jgi:hypothetical protein